MYKLEHLIIRCLNSVIFNIPLSDSDLQLLKTADLSAAYEFSKSHDIAHLVSVALEKNGIEQSAEVKGDFTKEKLLAVMRYTQQKETFDKLSSEFENAGIPFIPLKGVKIREYYGEPWHRTSCDLDILVHESDLKRANRVLVEACRFESKNRKGDHDISLTDVNGVHIELHYKLLPKSRDTVNCEVLNNPWKEAVKRAGYEYWYELSDSVMLLYAVVHMLKHIINGGIGIRAFCDLWVIERIIDDEDKKRFVRLIKQYDLEKFYNALSLQNDIWLSVQDSTDESLLFEEFIFSSGIDGNFSNKIKLSKGQKGGFRYMLSRIFMSSTEMQNSYPILDEHRWMLPFCWVHRWFRIAFAPSSGAKQEVECLKSVSESELKKTDLLLRYIGMKKN